MRLNRFIAATISYECGLSESEDESEYISAVQAVVMARDILLESGFVQVGRSNKSEACYLARSGSTWLRAQLEVNLESRIAGFQIGFNPFVDLHAPI